jgi:eukaryotic-like serine/threonine-protein kinase
MSDAKAAEAILFSALSGIEDASGREAFLDVTCAGNPKLRQRLEELIGLQEMADDFFKRVPVDDAGSGHPEPGNETAGTRIGHYQLIERLGEGGCGVVYLAEQKRPVRRRVALKIIRLGMDTESVIARFEMERQALAMMDHPNIARVFDAGATGSGRPFFVMEWVEGKPITDFCDQNRLGIPARLELFNHVCLAIQHAHQKGVIHRDIKPSNIIVAECDGVAVPKVIDFGIAKATAGGGGDDVTFTAAGQFMGTPSYMSPEQAENGGMDVDTRCDIYALGALLYELLAGRPPFDPKQLHQSDVEEIRRILREQEPSDPSTVVAGMLFSELKEVAAARSCDPQKLAGLLRGDLDKIVMMAMEKDRQLRYGSADALAADVHRHLNHEPVFARPSSRMYRFRRLVRRNQVVFVAGAMVLLALVAGLGASTWLFYRENQARHEQARLRNIAEQGLIREAGLREAAENQGKIAQAAVQLKYGNRAEADRLLDEIPPFTAQPSLESATTFRSLGEWHILEGRWKKAADRFTALVHAITAVDSSDTDEVSRDLLPAASSLCEAGDIEGYEQLRRMALKRFQNTNNPIVAEQLIKACLLRPADQAMFSALSRCRKVAGDARVGSNPHIEAWRIFALALMEHRRGDYSAVVEGIDRCLAFKNTNPAREASARFLRAMAWHRLGKPEDARVELEKARQIQGDHFTGKIDAMDRWTGFWFDWVNSRIFRREAELMMGL